MQHAVVFGCMPKISQYWYLIILFLAALALSPTMVLKTMALISGNPDWSNGFRGSLAASAFIDRIISAGLRLVPFAGLGIALVIVSKTDLRDYLYPLFFGGLAGIVATIFWASWAVLGSHSTGGQVSSSRSLSLMFIPFLGVPGGAMGAIFAGALYTPFRNLILPKRRAADNRRSEETLRE
ncbi:MAG: hypothetical protein JSW39_09400 [Desulfobacterales bacterium]|nr:MAG: hypothetical protein JSW39_09400 [Desulfobacterales bacterium]